MPRDNLDVSGDPLSPLAIAPSLEFSIVSDHLKGSLIVHDLSLPLAPLGDLQKRDGFEADASFDSQCGILVESEDIVF